jgi:hypothetical protein
MSNHPRRLPTHLAACLRHEGPGSGEVPPVGRERQDLQSGQNKYAFPRISAISQSDRNNNTSDSTGLNVQKWFDRSNHRPEASFHQAFDDGKYTNIW